MLVAPRSKVKVTAKPRQFTLTLEHLGYLALGALTVLLHFWLLGNRALHHDETIHAYYSWRLYRGEGYLHDPLTHGPFLYYWTALQYALFGDSDFTARLSAALFGIALTLLPWLLRRDLGRGAALLAVVYMIISPVALYVGRFIRHDVFAVTWELLCLVSILRYVATRRPYWIYSFAAAFALMYCTIETSYLFTLTLGSFMLLVTLWLVDRRLLLALGGYVALAGLALTLSSPLTGVVVKQAEGGGGWEPVLDINGNPQKAILPLVTEQQALNVRHQGDDILISTASAEGYISKLRKTLFGDPTSTIHEVNGQNIQGENGVFLHQSIALLAGLTMVFLLVMIWVIWLRRDDQRQSMWRRAVKRAQPRTLLPALDSLWSWHGLWAFSLAFVIYALFFTSFGSHQTGVISGITGSLLYWVGQHDVQRGGQPHHYYLVQLLVYEPLLLTAGIASMVGGMIHLVWQFVQGAGLTARRLAPGLLAWWAGGSLALYTWAGEKMPWITLHVVIPLTIIAAWGIATTLTWAFRQTSRSLRRSGLATSRRALATFIGLLLIVACFGVLRLTMLITPTTEPTNGSPSTPWLLALIAFIWAILMAGYAVISTPRRMLGGTLIAFGLLCGIYSMRSSWRLSYQNGDVPVEMLVYVQSSPDAVQVIRDLETASVAETGGLKLPIMYDNETIWKWYVRNFEEKTEFNGSMGTPPKETIQAILMIQENWTANETFMQGQGFVEQRYPLRWWFPEEQFYRFGEKQVLDPTGKPMVDEHNTPLTERIDFEADSTIGRFVTRPWDARTLNELARYLLFRQPPAPLAAVDFKIYVRAKYAHVFGLPATTQPFNPSLR